MSALPLLLAALALAQDYGSLPISTAPAVVAPEMSAPKKKEEDAVPEAPPEKPKLERPIRAKLHAEAKEWEPITLKAGGDPDAAETAVTLRMQKVKGKWRGKPAWAKASARLHKGKDESWLVISVFPKALQRRRMHLEVRFRLVEGYVEDVKAAAVSIDDARAGGAGLDAFELRRRGVSHQQDFPASGQVVVSALDPRPSKSARNCGVLKLGEFADQDLGMVELAWAVEGLR